MHNEDRSGICDERRVIHVIDQHGDAHFFLNLKIFLDDYLFDGDEEEEDAIIPANVTGTDYTFDAVIPNNPHNKEYFVN